MAFRYQNNSHTTDRIPSYYANNRLYPGSYTQNEVPTRTSRRVHDGMSLVMNYGLDTTSDDVNSSPYSSPYYVNGRYFSDNLTTQRASSASVQGTKFKLSVHDVKRDFSEDDIQTTLEMWQGKQIRFKMPFNGKIVGNTITVKNTGRCTGILSIYFSASEGGAPIYETAIDLCQVSEDKFDHIELRSMTVFPRSANPKGELFVRMEIWDEISMERSDNPFNTGRKIEIAATGKGSHEFCKYHLTDKNSPVEEVYEYEYAPSQPLVGLIYNDYTSVPVERIENEKRGATVSLNGYRYDLFVIKDGTHAEMIVYDKKMNKTVKNTIEIDGRTERVGIAQCAEYVYYVDGFSPLQKFKIGTWKSTVIDPGEGGDEDDTRPVIAASIIVHHNNRLYLGGFRFDPNLIQASAIDKTGPTYEVMPWRFYTPNNSPKATSLTPVTAIVELSTDELMIAGTGFVTRFQDAANFEDDVPTQVSIYADSIGVRTQGDICNYKGTLYAFDPDEGIRRFNGSTWSNIPSSVDSHIARVDMDKPRKLWGYANKLYFNYTDRLDGKYKCLIWDSEMNYQQYPWFQDIDIPFCDSRIDDEFDIVGIHPDYPCIMNLYAEDTWRRLDSPIVFERHTKYISLPGNADDMILKRVHNKVLANANRWWWFGISSDKHELTQYRGRDNWYRMPCWDTLDVEQPVETPFPYQDVYEQDSIARLTMNNIRISGLSVQEKIKTKTFRAQASLVSTLFESGVRQYN